MFTSCTVRASFLDAHLNMVKGFKRIMKAESNVDRRLNSASATTGVSQKGDQRQRGLKVTMWTKSNN